MTDTALNALRAIQDDFALFDDAEERYGYIIDAGKRLPPLTDSDKTDIYKVRGCVSSVWLHFSSDDNGILSFYADSDAFIVKGLLAIVLRIYSKRTPEDILSLPITDVAAALELNHQLSRSRNNGFLAVGERIHAIAKESILH